MGQLFPMGALLYQSENGHIFQNCFNLMPGPLSSPKSEGEPWLRLGRLFLSTLLPWLEWSREPSLGSCLAPFRYLPQSSSEVCSGPLCQRWRPPPVSLPAVHCHWGPTTVPLGRQTIISTGKLYFSRCRRASCRWRGFSCWICRDNDTSWYLGPVRSWGLPQATPPDPVLTFRSSSSFTRDQVLIKLSLRRVRMGGLSRTVSRRVRPEPVQGKAKGE